LKFDRPTKDIEDQHAKNPRAELSKDDKEKLMIQS
jgi:hypothetical protein